MVLHSKKGVKLIIEPFGGEAWEPAELDILENIQLFKRLARQISDDWNWYGEPFLLQIKDYARLYAEMKKLYQDL